MLVVRGTFAAIVVVAAIVVASVVIMAPVIPLVVTLITGILVFPRFRVLASEVLAATAGVGIAPAELIVVVVVIVVLLHHWVAINHTTSVFGFMFPWLGTMANTVSFPWAIVV